MQGVQADVPASASEGREGRSQEALPALSAHPALQGGQAWTNFFVLTGQAERKSSTFFCLLARFVFNIVVLVVIIVSLGFTETDLRTIGVISIILGVCGLIFLSLFCNSEWSPRKTANSGEGKTE